MKRIALLVLLVGVGLLASVAVVSAAPIEAGHWMQTSSTAGDCADCSLEIAAPTAHLREIHASNGWVAYLQYDPEEDRYSGFMELTREPEPDLEDWRGIVFSVEAVMDEHTLTIEAEGGSVHFRATYRLDP